MVLACEGRDKCALSIKENAQGLCKDNTADWMANNHQFWQ